MSGEYPIEGEFAVRHLGPRSSEISAMLSDVGYDSMVEFIADVIPERIRFDGSLNIPPALNERESLEALSASREE